MKNRIPLATRLGAAVGCLLLAGPAAAAQEGRPPRDPEAAFQTMFERVARELELTDGQRPEVEPILREHYDALRAARKEFDGEGGKNRDQLRKRYEELGKKTEERLSAVLDDDQLASYRELREEGRERLRRRGRATRGAPAI